MIVKLELWRLLSESKKVKITSIDKSFDVPIDFDVERQSKFNDDQTVSSTTGCPGDQTEKYIFEALMLCVNLTFNFGTKEVSSRNKKKPLREGGFETTTLDFFAYTWDLQKTV